MHFTKNSNARDGKSVLQIDSGTQVSQASEGWGVVLHLCGIPMTLVFFLQQKYHLRLLFAIPSFMFPRTFLALTQHSLAFRTFSLVFSFDPDNNPVQYEWRVSNMPILLLKLKLNVFKWLSHDEELVTGWGYWVWCSCQSSTFLPVIFPAFLTIGEKILCGSWRNWSKLQIY